MKNYRPTDAEDFYQEKGEIIDQEGIWYLVRVPTYANWESWVIHGCKEFFEGGFMGHELGGYASCDLPGQICEMCREKTPERLQALWTLHNFDRLAK